MDLSTIQVIISITTSVLLVGVIYGIMKTQIAHLQHAFDELKAQQKDDLKVSELNQQRVNQIMMDNIKDDIKRLENKQDKHNGIYDKVINNERSLYKLHKRIDDIKEK